MNSRLYVGNLPPGVTEDALRVLFSRVGGVAEVRLVLDPATQQSRGHAFVTMASAELASAALTALHSYGLDGRYIVVTEARPPQEPKGLIGSGFDLGPASFSARGEQRQNQRQKNGRRPPRPRGRTH